MSDKKVKYILNTPEEYVGDVLAELNRRGVHLDNIKNLNGTVVVNFNAFYHEMIDFSEWLDKVTENKGSTLREIEKE